MNEISKSDDKQENTPKPKIEKKIYHSPDLEVYGKLDRLTKGGGGVKNEPGGPGTPNTKA